MKKLLLIALFSVLAHCSFAQTQVTKEYKEALNEFMTVTNGYITIDLIIDQVLYQYTESSNAEVLERFKNKIKSEVRISFLDLVVNSYIKYLSLDDLKEAIAFYKSPVGKRIAESSPLITEDVMPVSQEWSMKIAQDVISEYQKELGN